MKKTLVTATAMLACIAAFGQGKIGFNNDSLHLVYFDPSIPLIGGQTAYAGGSNQPTLMADLYVGKSSSTLSLLTSTTFSAAPGKWNLVPTTVAGSAGGSSIFVIAQMRGASDVPAPTLTPLDAGSNPSSAHYIAWQNGLATAWGTTVEFQFTLGSSPLSYPFMYSSAGNWPVGPVDVSGVNGNLPGSRAALDLYAHPIPEPTTFALAGLGAAALLIFRRRK